MRTKNTIYNILTAIILQISSIIIGLIIPKMMINTYGSSLNGLISSIEQFVLLFNLLEGGILVATSIQLYKPINEGDKEKINKILYTLKTYYIKTGIIFTIVLILFSLIYPLVLIKQVPPLTVFVLVIIRGSLSLYNYFIIGKYNIIFTAHQKSYVLNLINILTRIVAFLVQYFLIKNNFSIYYVQLIACLQIIFRAIPTINLVKKKYPFVNFKLKHEKIKLSGHWDALSIQVSGFLKKNSPIVVLNFVSELKYVSVYSVYAMLYQTGNTLFEVISQSITSTFGNVLVNDSKEKLKNIYRISEMAVTIFISILSCMFLNLAVPFVTLYVGDVKEVNYIVPGLSLMFAIIEYINQLGFVSRTIATSGGLLKEMKASAFFEFLFSFLFGFVGYYLWGLNGILIGVIVGTSVRTINAIRIVHKKVLEISIKEKFVRVIYNLFLIIITILILKRIRINVISYSEWTILAIVTLVISSIIILFGNYIIDKETFRNLMKRFSLFMNRGVRDDNETKAVVKVK